MNKLAPFLIAVALAAPACFLAARSMQAVAAPPVQSVVSPAPAANVAGPVDTEYMVPGVLDDRSWKPDYDRAVAVQAIVRPIMRRMRPAAVAQPSAQDQAPVAAEAPIAAPEIAPAPLPADAADPTPSDRIL